jgi:hypothetical protein
VKLASDHHLALSSISNIFGAKKKLAKLQPISSEKRFIFSMFQSTDVWFTRSCHILEESGQQRAAICFRAPCEWREAIWNFWTVGRRFIWLHAAVGGRRFATPTFDP